MEPIRFPQEASGNVSWLLGRPEPSQLFSWGSVETCGKSWSHVSFSEAQGLAVRCACDHGPATRRVMGALAPGSWESQPGGTSGTDVALVPRANLVSSPGYRFGSCWLICAHSHLLSTESVLLSSMQYLTLSFLFLPILESVKNFFSQSTPAEAAEPR